MKKAVLAVLLSLALNIPAMPTEYVSHTFFINGVFNIGTFSAGEFDGGSVCLGGSISTDWLPNRKTGLSYGFETALLGGKKQDNIIYGVPIVFRLGWCPSIFRFEKIELFILGKIGWGFGIWGSNANEGSTPGGIVSGINLGCRYSLTSIICAYGELGYNYYGLARNSNYPEYPLGYGSGKAYTSIGLSLKFDK